MRSKSFAILIFLFLSPLTFGSKTTEIQIMAPLRAKFPAKDFKTVYIADLFVFGQNDKDTSVNINVNKEIKETLRSELIDRSAFEVKELGVEVDKTKKPEEMLTDPAFWLSQDIEKRDGGLILAGSVEFSNFDKGGLLTERVRDPRTGTSRVVTTSRDRLQLVLAVNLYLIDAKTGNKLFQESFKEEEVYSDVSNVSLPLFYDIFEKIAPKIVGILVPYRVGGSRILLEP